MRKFLTLTLLSLVSFWANAQNDIYDLVVYGGNSSGVIAAYTAAKTGQKVALLEATDHIGGLTTSGIGNIDVGWATTIGGYTKDFLRRAGIHYGKKGIATNMECSVAERIFDEMMEEENVEIFFRSRLKEGAGVKMDSCRITSIVMEDGREFKARNFIDASYEGDLMAQAGVMYVIGREPVDLYDESSAGVQRYITAKQLRKGQLDTVRMLRRRFPLDHVFGQKAETGSADGKTQAYVYRLCVTDNPDNMVPFPKPSVYVPERYLIKLESIVRRRFTRFKQVFTLYTLPNRKYDLNHMDLINASWSYPEADYATRNMIDDYHIEYQKGFLYFLANDPRVPEDLQADVNKYGLAKDEFADNGNWPYQIYIREARRMVGEYVMRQQDAWENYLKDDAVAIGSYFLDCHMVSSIITPEGRIEEEGHFENTPYRPYHIPYRSIIPKRDQCTNLFVTSCISASHVIFASLRMEPVYMMLGQAAAAASSLAIRDGVDIQDVDIKELQALLREQKQLLEYQVPANMYLRQQDFDGMVMDDTNATLKGDWEYSTSQGPFMNAGYVFAPGNRNGTMSISYTPFIDSKGKYEVFIMYSPSSNRSSSVPVTVTDRKGQHTVYVNQTVAPSKDGLWESVGVYDFDPQKEHKVVISNRTEKGIVIADGLRLVKYKEDASAAQAKAKSRTRSDVVLYPIPEGEQASALFKASINGDELAVYDFKVSPVDRKSRFRGMDDKKGSHLYYEKAAFCYFDIAKKVTVKISAAAPVESAKVLPSSLGIKARINGGDAYVDILPGQKLTVEVNGDEYHSLHLFANEIEKEPVDRSDPNTIYFGPGVHRVGRVVVRDNQTLYIDGGAVLMCDTSDKPEGPYHPSITLAGKNITVRGRGIIDGSLCPNLSRNLLCVESCRDVRVEGIILRDASVWTLPVRHSENVEIDNVKILGYRANSDGIDICNSRNVSVENCFIRTLDDLIVLKTLKRGEDCTDITVRKNVLWNEVAHALSVGAEINHDISNVVFEDCDIIHDKGREWSLRVYHCDDAVVSNVTFNKIRIEESQKFISLWINAAVWSQASERGHIRNITFKDISANNVVKPTIQILGFDDKHLVENVTFSNISVNGKAASAENLHTNEFTKNVNMPK